MNASERIALNGREGAQDAPAADFVFAEREANSRAGSSTRLASIGEVSREFGVTLRALRFYEDKGLIAPLRQGVTRLYRPEDRRRLSLILKGKRLGFTLQRIRALIDTPAQFDDPETHRPEIVRALSPTEVASQLETLQRQRDDLDEAIAELRATFTRMSAAA